MSGCAHTLGGVVDPGIAITIGQVVLNGVREAWSRLQSRNEVNTFFRVLPDLIAEDRHLPWNEREQIADAASFLGSNPDSQPFSDSAPMLALDAPFPGACLAPPEG